MNIICTINARGGSKGIKNKNVKEICDIPLIAFTILQAKASKLFSSIAVSSDSDEILSISMSFGADIIIKRPLDLASDNAPKISAIRHCLLEAEKYSGQKFDLICDLDATSPLRNLKDIKNSIDLILSNKGSNVITGCISRRSPYFNLVELTQNGVPKLSKPPNEQIVRRQDSPKCYDLNASIYVWWREKLFENDSIFFDDTLFYEMPVERSMDIDSEIDFKIVEHLIKNRQDIQELIQHYKKSK